MRVLVTGGTGFVGSNLALALEEAGHEVLVTGDRSEQELTEFKGQVLYRDRGGIPFKQVGEIDALFHQGANADTTVLDRSVMFRDNVETSEALFHYAAEHGVKHIVYASSTAVYGNLPTPYREDGPVAPLNPYGESKAALDVFAMRFASAHPSIRVVGLRYCNVYGPREDHKLKMANIIYQLALQMKTGNPRIFKWGEQKREYIYVKDVVQANILSLDARESAVLNCSGGEPTSFNEIVRLLNRTLKLDRQPEYIDNPYEGLYQNHIECDVSRIKSVIGFVPHYSVAQGIQDYFDTGFLPR
jgi:ADP-L-glycero-D-manno-heptose 6-epimerase